MTYPPKAFPGLLALTVLLQGTIGFISWPLLSEIQPFGPEPALGNFLLLLVPTVPLYLWPLRFQAVHDQKLLQAGVIGNRPLIAMAHTEDERTCDDSPRGRLEANNHTWQASISWDSRAS